METTAELSSVVWIGRVTMPGYETILANYTPGVVKLGAAGRRTSEGKSKSPVNKWQVHNIVRRLRQQRLQMKITMCQDVAAQFDYYKYPEICRCYLYLYVRPKSRHGPARGLPSPQASIGCLQITPADLKHGPTSNSGVVRDLDSAFSVPLRPKRGATCGNDLVDSGSCRTSSIDKMSLKRQAQSLSCLFTCHDSEPETGGMCAVGQNKQGER